MTERLVVARLGRVQEKRRLCPEQLQPASGRGADLFGGPRVPPAILLGERIPTRAQRTDHRLLPAQSGGHGGEPGRATLVTEKEIHAAVCRHRNEGALGAPVVAGCRGNRKDDAQRADRAQRGEPPQSDPAGEGDSGGDERQRDQHVRPGERRNAVEQPREKHPRQGTLLERLPQLPGRSEKEEGEKRDVERLGFEEDPQRIAGTDPDTGQRRPPAEPALPEAVRRHQRRETEGELNPDDRGRAVAEHAVDDGEEERVERRPREGALVAVPQDAERRAVEGQGVDQRVAEPGLRDQVGEIPDPQSQARRPAPARTPPAGPPCEVASPTCRGTCRSKVQMQGGRVLTERGGLAAAAGRRAKPNAADGPFSAACYRPYLSRR